MAAAFGSVSTDGGKLLRSKGGVAVEYDDAWKERYDGGSHTQARTRKTGRYKTHTAVFGDWYPSMEVWRWRRTLSYWIAITFFEGSVFFTISSFMFCYADRLGVLKFALTTGGYMAGKVNYWICCWFMCIETINLSTKRVQVLESGSECSDEDEEEEEPESPYLWPFHARRAMRNLKRVGSSPWPYYTSVTYLIGVMLFTAALACEFIGLPEEVEKQSGLLLFLLGSLLFTVGGFAECMENEVFTGIACSIANIGALLNFVGGLFFLIGSVLGYVEGQSYNASFTFGIGSLAYAIGSALMIVMWKDEQFGLTYLSVLNQVNGPRGRPLVVSDTENNVKEKKTFSFRGTILIIVYCFGASFATYNFLIALAALNYSGLGKHRIWLRAWNALLPAAFVHMLLALNCGVIRSPKMSPFRQLYHLCRVMGVLVCIGSGLRCYCAVVSGHGDIGEN
eukprot:TRINITY_DN12552_c0_g1_i1.p1 TRINITY_DN12552_c0_g1~~TRINITY_DN12552_c0_g1_i1.p1  ORF type:complete len:451 (-),score=48.03 TRINITY_DN12552_c0_g1_i1:111-1463(-)